MRGTSPAVAGAVLAAGAGTRMGRPKAEIELGGTRLVDRAVSALRDGGCTPVFAVVRAGVVAAGALEIVNDDPSRGMRSSLALAVDAAQRNGVAALAVLLVDVPGVGADAVRTVVSAWRPGRIARASFAGRPGHPIVMSPDDWFAALASAGPDDGARHYLAEHLERVDAVPATGDPTDLDVPADLLRWSEAAADDGNRAD